MSFIDHEGFRCGIYFPCKPFDVLENRVLNIWELPLIIMDESLFNYQNLTPEEGFQRIKGLIDAVKNYDGLFMLLWHNSSLDNEPLHEIDSIHFEKHSDFVIPGLTTVYVR